MTEELLFPCLVSSDDAAKYDHLQGEKIHVLLSGQDTGGGFALFIDEVPPNVGLPLHTHEHEDETRYVLEGQLLIQIKDERAIVPTGCVAFLPRGIPHTFTNPGPGTARVLVVLTPGGLEQFFAEAEPLLAQEEPDLTAVLTLATSYGIEEATSLLAEQASDKHIVDAASHVIRPETADTLGVPGGDTIRMMLGSEQTGGRIALLVGAFPPGSGASLHQHRHEDEVIYVLKGKLSMQTGRELAVAAAGSAAFLPRGTPHAFRNDSEQSAEAIALITPAGFEKYFIEFFALFAEGRLDDRAVVAMAQRYGLQSFA